MGRGKEGGCMATYLIEVSLINGQKIAFEDDFIDEVHVATA